jgi:hypothetical protein
MNHRLIIPLAAGGLVIGAVLGVAGSFVSSPEMRTLLWGIDGIALIGATALLTVYHVRRGNDLLAAGFLAFVAGETLILGSSAFEIIGSGALFGTGAGVWAASLAIISLSGVMRPLIRALGWVASFAFAVVAIQIFLGAEIHPLSRPLPFFAYPVFAATIIGWAWEHYQVHLKRGDTSSSLDPSV